MEPIGHEGLGRLLKLEEDLCTPHIVFSKEDLTESPDLNSTGTITIGKSFDLPPTPMGLDSNKEPYLQLSKDIAVFDNAYSLKPEKIVEIASKFREEAGYSRLIYAPAVEPSNMPILAYLGVDIFDDLNPSDFNLLTTLSKCVLVIYIFVPKRTSNSYFSDSRKIPNNFSNFISI